MARNVVLDCPECAVRVSAPVVGALHNSDSFAVIVLSQCPSCSQALLGLTETFQVGDGNWDYEAAERLWPTPTTIELNTNIPEKIRKDIRDAQKCVSHGIYSAAVVMCGKALERFVRERVPGKNLAQGLEALKIEGVIDDRLIQWADALRKERNLGAHAGEEDVTKEDAQDVLDFTIAIFEYIYTLSQKYAAYLSRKSEGRNA